MHPIGCGKINNMTTYTKEKIEKYTEVTYIPDIEITFNQKYKSKQWCLSDSDADKFISKTKQLEALISSEIVNRNLGFKPQLIMLTWLPIIDSICSGLDVRSKMSNEELINLFINVYQKKYNEAFSFCKETIAMYEESGKNESYTKHWRDYGKHNELVDEYQFDLRKFKDSDFAINLEKIKKDAQELLDLLIKENNL